MAALHSAAEGLQAEMHDVDVQAVESWRIVEVKADFSCVKAELVLEQVVEGCLKALEQRNVLSCKISQGVEFRIAEERHQMKFLDICQVSVLKVRNHQKIIVLVKHSFSFRLALDDIIDPLYMCELLLQDLLLPCRVFLSTLVMNLHFLAPVLVLMLLVDGVNELDVNIRGN